jgi:hypothetical protein
LPDHQWVRGSGRCIALEHDEDFLKVKQVECALAVEIENAQIVGFTQVTHGDLEVPAITFFGHRQRNLVSDEFLDAFGTELIEQRGSVSDAYEVTITSGPLPANNKAAFMTDPPVAVLA